MLGDQGHYPFSAIFQSTGVEFRGAEFLGSKTECGELSHQFSRCLLFLHRGLFKKFNNALPQTLLALKISLLSSSGE